MLSSKYSFLIAASKCSPYADAGCGGGDSDKEEFLENDDLRNIVLERRPRDAVTNEKTEHTPHNGARSAQRNKQSE